MSTKDLLEQMAYCSVDEKAEAQKYIELKGIVQYQRVIDYCRIEKDKPTYRAVSSLYKYDKRLRDKLYIYIATIEEYLRACLGNAFEDNENGLVKTMQFKKNK